MAAVLDHQDDMIGIRPQLWLGQRVEIDRDDVSRLAGQRTPRSRLRRMPARVEVADTMAAMGPSS